VAICGEDSALGQQVAYNRGAGMAELVAAVVAQLVAGLIVAAVTALAVRVGTRRWV